MAVPSPQFGEPTCTSREAVALSTPADIVQAFYPTQMLQVSTPMEASIPGMPSVPLATSALVKVYWLGVILFIMSVAVRCKILRPAPVQHQPMPFRTARSIKMAMRAQLARQLRTVQRRVAAHHQAGAIYRVPLTSAICSQYHLSQTGIFILSAAVPTIRAAQPSTQPLMLRFPLPAR